MMGIQTGRNRGRRRTDIMSRKQLLNRGREMTRDMPPEQRGLGRNGLIGGVLGAVAAGLLYRTVSRRRAAGKSVLPSPKKREINLESSITIERPAEEVYNFWRGFVNLPKVMTFLDRIEDRGGRVTHWKARGPLGTSIEWDSEVIDDVPNARISWQSVQGSDINTWGTVKFYGKPQKGNTDVWVNLNFEPPGRMVGAAVGQFLAGLENAMLNQNLRNLKAYLETGELPTNKRSGNGRRE